MIPLSCIFAGLSVIVDRQAGAQRELLAAPIPRAYLVLGNLIVAVVLSALQAIVLVGLTALRGGAFHITSTGIDWALAAGLLFTVFMYGVAETLAARIGKAEEYVGAVPAVAILPFFFAGALYPISAMPGALATIAKFLPLTHALALLRYGLIDPQRPRPTRHLGRRQPDHPSLREPRGRRGVRSRADSDRDPRVHARSSEVNRELTRQHCAESEFARSCSAGKHGGHCSPGALQRAWVPVELKVAVGSDCERVDRERHVLGVGIGGKLTVVDRCARLTLEEGQPPPHHLLYRVVHASLDARRTPPSRW